ncbi:CDP-diacylglycerol-inositol 3-phosphatidyltransferase [Cantharellus anzutake]|uniref:CDP-diacylglycerol-inositol 3-phosphatidyltransferase n=1 Tax=Cantharellus anzutake TaxID=1750568 RepID=UPI00190847D0|nr:CDP-diacylglycerol-inositol 3-phosphatidyltransferase [Cantharellus anzutake]KAF8343939.1 CDP-diacylglycerol-inositol 3-phosphatidyltransferase [Cantharellus anzutake]
MQRKRRSSSVASQTFFEERRRRNSDVDGAKVALDIATAQEENVFLFVPNLIGYTRVILAALSLHYMSTHPKSCTFLYALSCILDAADGFAARKLGQTSRFGAVLDMVTDRCTTSCLLCFLSSAYPDYATVFQFLIALDFSSHYMHMYSSLETGAKTHKAVTSEVSRILRFYYNPLNLFLICAGNELFFIALYLIKKWETSPIGEPFRSLALGFPYRYQAHVADITWPQLLAVLTSGVCFLKNIINVVQLWKASKILVGLDIAERASRRLERAMAESKEE